MSAREEVLARIAAAHRSAPPPDLPYAAITRTYHTTSRLSAGELVERLVDRLLDYRALVRRCSPADLAVMIAAALTERGASRVAVPDGLPADVAGFADIPAFRGAVLIDRFDAPLSVAELDAVDGVVTGCATAVAETGTLIVNTSPGQGRRMLTLIPDYHLCVVRTGQISANVPQALARLDPSRPLTMISGPSATSDIELNRVEGVHGPRTLEVVLVS